MPTYKIKHEATGKVFRIQSDTPRDPEEVKSELKNRVRDYFVNQSQTPVPEVPSVAETAYETIKPAITPLVSQETLKKSPVASIVSAMLPITQFMSGVPRLTPLTPKNVVEEGTKQVSAQTAPLAIAGSAGLLAGLKPGGILPRPSPLALTKKAEKITTEILQPSKGELTSFLSRGKQLPAIEEATKAIKASKNYTELKNNLNTTIKNTMNERNAILKQNNTPIGDYTQNLRNYIKKLELQGQATPSELKQMRDVLAREEKFLKSNKMDRLSGQKRKEDLQDLTDSLLQKTERGEIIDTQPARNRALDQLRRGLKEGVEAGDENVARLNSTYGGLREAKNLAAGQEALAQKAIPASKMEKIISLIIKPQDIPGEVARSAFNRQAGLFKQTKKISKLTKKAGAK